MIALGCDHGGYDLKQVVIAYLEEKGIPYKDFGCMDKSSCDYPVICTTGIGISIVANKVKGIRCALCHDCFSAKATRLHNNANMLAMGAGVIGPNLAREVVDIFLNTPFSDEERHNRRIALIEKL